MSGEHTVPDVPASRRDFLTGRALQAQVETAGGALADELAAEGRIPPSGGDTIRLSTPAMACEFSVIMNPGPAEQVSTASDALELVHALEDQMSVYREHSELSQLNRRAAGEPVPVESRLFALLKQSVRLCRETNAAFDPTSGPLIALWRRCRSEGRIPTQEEIERCLARSGIEHVSFDDSAQTVRFDRAGVELNLGGIGKGHALDRIAERLLDAGMQNWLLHGGHSSVLACGNHNGLGGWPVGIRNPLFPGERLATLVLKGQALSSSGSGVQFFRHGGRRYGHILDPRTGRPVEEMLSVTVLAPTAAEADALSTAFFVLGVEKARAFCDNHQGVSALLIPPPRRGRSLEPVNCGIPEDVLFVT